MWQSRKDHKKYHILESAPTGATGYSKKGLNYKIKIPTIYVLLKNI